MHEITVKNPKQNEEVFMYMSDLVCRELKLICIFSVMLKH